MYALRYPPQASDAMKPRDFISRMRTVHLYAMVARRLAGHPQARIHWNFTRRQMEQNLKRLEISLPAYPALQDQFEIFYRRVKAFHAQTEDIITHNEREMHGEHDSNMRDEQMGQHFNNQHVDSSSRAQLLAPSIETISSDMLNRIVCSLEAATRAIERQLETQDAERAVARGAPATARQRDRSAETWTHGDSEDHTERADARLPSDRQSRATPPYNRGQGERGYHAASYNTRAYDDWEYRGTSSHIRVQGDRENYATGYEVWVYGHWEYRAPHRDARMNVDHEDRAMPPEGWVRGTSRRRAASPETRTRNDERYRSAPPSEPQSTTGRNTSGGHQKHPDQDDRYDIHNSRMAIARSNSRYDDPPRNSHDRRRSFDELRDGELNSRYDGPRNCYDRRRSFDERHGDERYRNSRHQTPRSSREQNMSGGDHMPTTDLEENYPARSSGSAAAWSNSRGEATRSCCSGRGSSDDVENRTCPGSLRDEPRADHSDQFDTTMKGPVVDGEDEDEENEGEDEENEEDEEEQEEQDEEHEGCW